MEARPGDVLVMAAGLHAATVCWDLSTRANRPTSNPSLACAGVSDGQAPPALRRHSGCAWLAGTDDRDGVFSPVPSPRPLSPPPPTHPHTISGFGLRDATKFNFLWVEDFPLFEVNDEDTGSPGNAKEQDRLCAVHHCFTAPVAECAGDLESSPLEVGAGDGDGGGGGV